MTRIESVRAYYDALDAGDYDRLGDLLAPSFRQERPDRTFESRAAFVRFMREERPRTDTRHPIDAIYERQAGGDGGSEGGHADSGTGDVAAEGRLVTADGERLAAFVDVFAFDGADIERLTTYTR